METAHPGDVVAGRYRIDGLLGEGGFATVYRAVHLEMNRYVALKVLHAHLLGSSYVDARFMREAELAKRLQHPNTVRLLDFGRDADGTPFLAYELLDGETLAELLARERTLDAARVKRIGSQILKSMLEAHGYGIVHRDIKPQNVFMARYPGETDFVKVLDFGIAKAPTDEMKQLTRAGAMIGTPTYMAPEQVRGEGVGPATDLYALGLVLAECVTGERVVRADSNAMIALEQTSDRQVPLAPAVVRSQLGPIILRATQKQVERRFQSAAEMLALLDSVQLGPSIPVPVSVAPPSASLPTSAGVVPTMQATSTFPPTHSSPHYGSIQPTGVPLAPPAPKKTPVALIIVAIVAVLGLGTTALVLGHDLVAGSEETQAPKKKKKPARPTESATPPPPASASPPPAPPPPPGALAGLIDDHDSLHRAMTLLGWRLDNHQFNKAAFATSSICMFERAAPRAIVTVGLWRFQDQRSADSTVASMVTGGAPGAILVEGNQVMSVTEATGLSDVEREVLTKLTGKSPTTVRGGTP